MRKIIQLWVILFCGFEVSAQLPPRISHDFFGVTLGMDHGAFLQSCHNVRLTPDTRKWEFSDEDHPGSITSVNGAINGNKAVEETKVSVHNLRIYEVEVVFRDGSLHNYKILKAALEKKYGKDQATLADELENKSLFSTIIDNQKVNISLNHDIAFNDDGGTIALKYSYEKLHDRVVSEMNRRKTSKVADDL